MTALLENSTTLDLSSSNLLSLFLTTVGKLKIAYVQYLGSSSKLANPLFLTTVRKMIRLLLLLLLLLLFLIFSPLVAKQGGKKKKKYGSAPPPPPSPPALLVREKKKKKKSRDASKCLGATQVGVTQVVSVHLASVQGFLRLVG